MGQTDIRLEIKFCPVSSVSLYLQIFPFTYIEVFCFLLGFLQKRLRFTKVMQCVLLVVFKVRLSEQFKIQFSMAVLKNLATRLGIQMGADPVIEYF